MSEKRVALVTGAGSGIGRATVGAMAAQGWEVILVGRRREPLHAVAQQIGSAARIMPCDLTNPESIHLLALELGRDVYALDALVNCAAQTMPTPLATVTASSAEDLWRVNVVGPMLLTQAMTRLLSAASSQAVVVNVTTSIGQRAWPGSGVYAATKAALESLTRTWAVELAPQGIRVVAVAPGAVETPMAAASGATPVQVEALRVWQRSHTPLGRVGQPEEIAQVIEFVCSSATFVTGAVLAVDGGAVVA